MSKCEMIIINDGQITQCTNQAEPEAEYCSDHMRAIDRKSPRKPIIQGENT